MELSLEIVLWFFISLVLGIAIFSFVIGVDYNNFFNTMKSSFINEKDEKISGKTINETIYISLELWKECGFGEIEKSRTIYINESGTLTKDIYFERIKNWNLCNLISHNQSIPPCGKTNDLKDFTMIVPKIIQIKCNPSSKQLEFIGG